MLNIFSIQPNSSSNKIPSWKEKISSTFKEHKVELLFGVFLSSLCSFYAYKLGVGKSILNTTANMASNQFHVTNLALLTLTATSGISLLSCFYQRKQLANAKNMLKETNPEKNKLINNEANPVSQELISNLKRELNEVKQERDEAHTSIRIIEECLKEKRRLGEIFLPFHTQSMLTERGCQKVAEVLSKKNFEMVKRELCELVKLKYEDNIKGASEDAFLSAIELGNLEMAGKIKKEYGINSLKGVSRDNGDTVLHVAAKQKDVKVFEHFIDEGIDINVLNNLKETPLMIACEIGNLPVVNYLLQLPGIVLTLRGFKKASLMHYAAIGGNVEIIKCLVDKGLDINAQCESLWTPVLYAIKFCNVEVVEYLISKGAKVSEGDLKYLLGYLKELDHNSEVCGNYEKWFFGSCHISILLAFLKKLKGKQRSEFIAFFDRNMASNISKHPHSVKEAQDDVKEDF